jgi:hypothetical protein
MPCGRSAAWLSASWSYGVTASTLDSESSDRGSNPRRTLFNAGWACGLQSLYQHLGFAIYNVQGASPYLFSRPEERRGPNPCCLDGLLRRRAVRRGQVAHGICGCWALFGIKGGEGAGKAD